MNRKTVAILFSSEPNFEEFAYKFFILSLNKIQDQYEFIFPEEDKYHYSGKYCEKNKLFQTFENKIRPNIQFESIPDYFINIITQKIEDNLFWIGSDDVIFITTNTWEKYYSPPSLFEYLSHSLVISLLILDFNLESHSDTRGCCLDYCFYKKDKKVDIVLGYICDKCKEQIIDNGDKRGLEALMSILDREWIGNINDFGSIAYDLKKFFIFDIEKQSGFNKTSWEKIKEPFYSLPKDTFGYFISALIGALILLLYKTYF